MRCHVLFSCRGFHSYSEIIDHYHKDFELSRFTKIASKQLCVLKCSLSQLGIVFHYLWQRWAHAVVTTCCTFVVGCGIRAATPFYKG